MAYNIIIPHTAFESKDDHPLLGPLELDWTYLQIRSLTESPRREAWVEKKGDSWRGEVNELLLELRGQKRSPSRFALDPLRTSECEQINGTSFHQKEWMNE